MTASYFPFWVGGLALAAVPVLHWALLGRTFAVSGRFSALVDRVRHGKAEPAPDTDALLAAIRAQTAELFGAGALSADSAVADTSDMPAANGGADTAPTHAAFFVGLALGGLLSVCLSKGGPSWTLGLQGPVFSRMFGHGPLSYAVLFAGGSAVGFGTRMAGGCTSGHGLCGVSQRQPGSLVATAAFFGAAVLTSFALELL